MTDEKDEPEPEDGQFFLDVRVLEEEIFIDIRGEDQSADDYWAEGWSSDAVKFRRTNRDSYKNLSYKVFPTRYRLKDAIPTKSLRRVLAGNADLKTVIRPLRITEKKEQLHKSHHLLRYGSKNYKSLASLYDYISLYPAALKELCIFKDRELVACSIFEAGKRSVYSHIAFWDLDEQARSLGILTVLLEMQYGIARGFTHYYLGHYFAKNPIYQYKTRFRGLELYDWDNARWVNFEDPYTRELLAQKLPYA